MGGNVSEPVDAVVIGPGVMGAMTAGRLALRGRSAIEPPGSRSAMRRCRRFSMRFPEPNFWRGIASCWRSVRRSVQRIDVTVHVRLIA